MRIAQSRFDLETNRLAGRIGTNSAFEDFNVLNSN